MMIFEYIVIGFFTAFGWWGAGKFVIEPHLDPYFDKTEMKADDGKEKNMVRPL